MARAAFLSGSPLLHGCLVGALLTCGIALPDHVICVLCMKIHSTAALLLGGILLASCAPTQGVRPTLYKGSSAEILATIGQFAPTIQPSRVNSYFSVEGITPTAVTLRAKPVLGFQIVNALAGNAQNDGSITVIFTALENTGVTSVTHSTSDTRNTPEFIAKVYAELDKRFQRIQQP